MLQLPTKPTAAGALITASFELYAVSWRKLFRLAMVLAAGAMLPHLLVMAGFGDLMKNNIFHLSISVVMQGVNAVISALMISQTYQIMHKKTISINASLQQVMPYLFILVLVHLLLYGMGLFWQLVKYLLVDVGGNRLDVGTSLIILLAGMLMIYGYVRLSFAIPIILLEDKSLLAALIHSWYRTKGYVMHIITVICIPMIIIPMVLVLSIVITVVLHAMGLVLSLLILAAVSPLMNAFYMMLYYDLRLRREVSAGRVA